MDHSNNSVADPKELSRAQSMWHNFTVGGKYSVIIIVAILVLMALFLL